MPEIEAIAARAEAVDGAAPFDEATLMALRAGTAEVLRKDGAIAVVVGDELNLLVDPPVRRHGLGEAMLEDVLNACPQVRRAWSHGNHPAAARLAETFGWVRVRDLWVMRRPMTGPEAEPLPEVVVPDDVVLHRFGQRPGDSMEIVAVNAAAFAAHPEQGSMDLANMATRMSEPWFDPEGLIIAIPADPTAEPRTLGFHWTKRHSPTLGEVYVVGVHPQAQGRGIGRLLTLAGLHHLAEKGVDEVILYVEADNEAAIATYTSLGFTHDSADTHVMYERDMHAPGQD